MGSAANIISLQLQTHLIRKKKKTIGGRNRFNDLLDSKTKCGLSNKLHYQVVFVVDLSNSVLSVF